MYCKEQPFLRSNNRKKILSKTEEIKVNIRNNNREQEIDCRHTPGLHTWSEVSHPHEELHEDMFNTGQHGEYGILSVVVDTLYSRGGGEPARLPV